MAGDDLVERQAVAEHFKTQASWCYGLGSPLYGRLLERSAADCEAGGVVWSILQGYQCESLPAAAVALRFMGAVHRLVLTGALPALAQHYPSVGGTGTDLGEAWSPFHQALIDHRDELRELSRLPVQTNEVGRSGVLFGGFLAIAKRTRLPLRLLEIGSSAGLNLRWDRYRYEMPDAAWGDERSPVRFTSFFDGARPSFDVPVEIAARAGCDLAPLDPCSEEGRATLRAYLWPDQLERVQRLNGALQVAESLPLSIERIGAGDFLARELADRFAGVATVVFHSIMIQYVPRDERRSIAATIRAAGERADVDAPLAWLRFEPAKDESGNWVHRVDLSLWPGGEEKVLGHGSPHGPPVSWIGG